MTPSSELRMSRLFSVKCHFRGNKLANGEGQSAVWGSQRRHLSDSMQELWQSWCRGNGEKSRSWSRRAQEGSWGQRYIKIHKTKQEVSRGTTKQICYHRPYNKRKPPDRLGPGESVGARVWPQDQIDQGGDWDPQEQGQMYEPWHRVVLPVNQFWQVSSPWASSFPQKWQFTEKSRLILSSEEVRRNVSF